MLSYSFSKAQLKATKKKKKTQKGGRKKADWLG